MGIIQRWPTFNYAAVAAFLSSRERTPGHSYTRKKRVSSIVIGNSPPTSVAIVPNFDVQLQYLDEEQDEEYVPTTHNSNIGGTPWRIQPQRAAKLHKWMHMT